MSPDSSRFRRSSSHASSSAPLFHPLFRLPLQYISHSILHHTHTQPTNPVSDPSLSHLTSPSTQSHSTLHSKGLRANQPLPAPLLPTPPFLRSHDPVLNAGAAAGDAVYAGVAPLGGLAHRVQDGGVLAARVPVGRVLDLDAGVARVGVLDQGGEFFCCFGGANGWKRLAFPLELW